VTAFRIRRADWPEFSGRETWAAASSRSACVLMDGCPVLSVHFSFGLAPHLGQRTDNIRPNVSFSLFTPTLFSINNWIDGQFCSLDFDCPKAGNQMGLIRACN